MAQLYRKLRRRAKKKRKRQMRETCRCGVSVIFMTMIDRRLSRIASRDVMSLMCLFKRIHARTDSDL